ncbi:NAC domain-containing protein 41-like [Prunus avium]|uniref:NAC domain-containing protein 41-like n=1 Tax=Prunus avium TaxID=42229 RepID=A0A6P5T634_PRUAV|nr:NAC domain-containing protein 41-like [Prunus avium]
MSSSSGTTDERVSVPMGLLPGIKFSPTDKELLSFYLRNKIAGEDSEFSNIIPEINLRELEPRDLPEFFFSEPDYMSPNGDSCHRTTNEGFYRSTGKPREIEDELSKAVIGEKRYMPFHEGRAPEHKLTKYVLHQFSLTKTERAKLATNREFVLNHLTIKKGSTKARNPKPNYKKRKYDSNCDKLAEHGIPGYIASNYKDDQAAAAANMIPEPEEHLADKDGLFGSENQNECAESESANGSRLINNNDPFHDEVSFQTEGNLISPFHPSSLRDIPLRSPVHTGLVGDVVYANNSILIGMQ